MADIDDIVFAARSDTTAAYYSLAGRGEMISLVGASSTTQAKETAASAIGGFIYNVGRSGADYRQFSFDFYNNLDIGHASGWTALIRFKADYTGKPPSQPRTFFFWPLMSHAHYLMFGHYNVSGALYLHAQMGGDLSGEVPWNNALTSQIMSTTANQFYDLVVQHPGGTAHAVAYLDGVLFGTLTTSEAPNSNSKPTRVESAAIATWPGGNDVNEMVFWQSGAVSITSILLDDSTTGSLNGSSRTQFVKVNTPGTSFGTSVDPGIANVLSGTGYTINDASLTGTYHNLISADPGIANVKLSTGYTINDSSLTGTLQSTDPGVSNVLSGTSYIIEGSTLTGTHAEAVSSDPGVANVAGGVGYTINDSSLTGVAVLLSPGSGVSGTLDLNNLKEQVQTILQSANTTTASPVDLSANLSNSKRVQRINKLNPDRIPTQVTQFPYVTVYIDEKTIERDTVARNQQTGKRMAEVDLKIMGVVMNNTHTVDDQDPADEDINYLMENIELVIRAFPRLGGSSSFPILTSFPDGVEYYRDFLETEQTHVRAGLLTLKVKAHY